MILDSILNFFLPVRCVICNNEHVSLCESCLNSFKRARLRCLKCRKANPWGKYCSCCQSKWKPDYVLACFLYSGQLKELIQQYKYEDATVYGAAFANVMAQEIGNIAKNQKQSICLVPIPLSSKGKRERGYNQSELLSKEISKKLKIPSLNLLKRLEGKYTQVQSGDRVSRRRNVQGVFYLSGNFKVMETIILIDDVVTTGATIEEATKVLKKAGAKKVFAMALAMA